MTPKVPFEVECCSQEMIIILPLTTKCLLNMKVDIRITVKCRHVRVRV